MKEKDRNFVVRKIRSFNNYGARLRHMLSPIRIIVGENEENRLNMELSHICWVSNRNYYSLPHSGEQGILSLYF
jgi:hypothetical protein